MSSGLTQQFRSEDHHDSKANEHDPADNAAVFSISVSDGGIQSEYGEAENDQIVEHEKEIIDQDVPIVFKGRKMLERQGMGKNRRQGGGAGKFDGIDDKGQGDDTEDSKKSER